MSVMEMAQLKAVPGREDEMEAVLPAALAVIAATDACLGATAYRCIERPGEFTLAIGWDSVDDHERFRESDDFDRYRAAMAGPLDEVVGYLHYMAVAES